MISFNIMFFVGLFFAFSGKDMPKKFEDIFGPILPLELCLDVLFVVICAIGGAFEVKTEVTEFFWLWFNILLPFIISVFLTFKNADEKGEVEDD